MAVKIPIIFQTVQLLKHISSVAGVNIEKTKIKQIFFSVIIHRSLETLF